MLKEGKVIAVIELKSTKTKVMEKIVNQAFNYKNNHPTCKYIITSNFEKLRFYVEHSDKYEEFNLFTLNEERFTLFYTLLNKESILTDVALKLKQDSKLQEENISNELYKKYAELRVNLFENIIKNNADIDKRILLEKTQKILDRMVFIFFAEDRGILPTNTIQAIVDHYKDDIESRELYHFYKIYFNAISKGNPKLGIAEYNGGLFSADEVLDALVIDNHVIDACPLALSAYDFNSDIDVNILGHIFENSLNDIEEMKAKIDDEDFDVNKSKRKKDGVFYTPEYITKYIVDNTLGKLCEAKKEELGLADVEIGIPKNPKKLNKGETKQKDALEAYRTYLLELKILDPACGSGAFLNQALNFLLEEHEYIDESNRTLMGGNVFGLFDVNKGILENNLYGVDINAEAVEIAKLSLWLRTVEKGRKLNVLAEKLKVGNSLIDDRNVVDNAFVWEEEFPEVFEQGGFDVVIGNPPYVQLQSMGKVSDILKNQEYYTFERTGDLYVLFYELGHKLLKKNGLLGYITSNKWMRAKYGKSLRKYLSEKTELKILIDLGNKIFESATVDSNILILKNQAVNRHNCLALDLSKEEVFTQFNFNKSIIIDELNEDNWIISTPIEQQIRKKIIKNGTPLKEWDISINRGLLTGYNDAFIIDGDIKDRLIKEDIRSTKILKPILRGKDIHRYNPEFNNMWIITTFPALNLDINDYPAIKSYLEGFGRKIYQTGESFIDEKGNIQKSRKKTNNKWFETQDATAYYQDFENELLIWKRIGSILKFSLGKYYCLDSTCILSSEFNKYLLCVFNSKMGHYLMKDSPKTGTGDLLISVQAIEPLYIPMVTNQQPFIEQANIMLDLIKSFQTKQQKFLKRIHSSVELEKLSKKLEAFYQYDFKTFLKELKKKKVTLSLIQQDEWEEYFEAYQKELLELQAQIDITDKEIDLMVYELYGLSDDEIALVEGR